MPRRIAGAGAGGVRVEGYAPQRLARWIRLTGGAPSLVRAATRSRTCSSCATSGPEIWEAAATFLEPVDWLNLKLTGVRSASYDTATLHWVTDTRDPSARPLRRALLKLAGLDAARLPAAAPERERRRPDRARRPPPSSASARRPSSSPRRPTR